MNLRRALIIIYKALLHLFAVIGFVLVAVYVAVTFGLTNAKNFVDLQRTALQNNFSNTTNGKNSAGNTNTPTNIASAANPPAWTQNPEWITFATAIAKDAPIINRAAEQSGVPARLIVAVVATEQLRLFYTDREIYKQIFAPLGMLGVMSQYAWGVAGIKPDTAKAIEEHLVDRASPFYLGTSREHVLDFATTTATIATTTVTENNIANIDTQRFYRLTDEHDRSYSYLYAGLYINQIITQWQRAGFNIADKPGIIGTLYNIGFAKSQPNANPQIGGAAITIASSTYSFGGFVEDFYQSDALLDMFPRTAYTGKVQ